MRVIRSRRDPIRRNNFSVFRWLVSQVFRKLREAAAVPTPATIEERRAVYQAYREEYQEKVIELPAYRIEKVIAADVAEALREEGIRVFPPVFFRLWFIPKVLVVSRRDKIARIHPEPLLQPDLTETEIEEIERFVEQDPELSAYAANLGGLAAIPPIVEFYDPETVVEIAAHEWCHTFLFRFPLGIRGMLGMLGIDADSEASMINEITCRIVGLEIQERIAQKYGWGSAGSPLEQHLDRETAKAEARYNAVMRGIRREVDRLLEMGMVEEAEEFMRVSRDSLQQRGVRIRRLNQAVFAFHGSYGGGAAGDSPIPRQMGELRESSGSLKSFLEKIRWVGSLQGFRRLLDEEGIE